MASIIKASIDLNKIPKEKIFIGKKGKYLPITITVNDEPDQFGNPGPVIVVWTNGENVDTPPRDGEPAPKAAPAAQPEADLPF